jgi:DNA/RNA endonuclease G (NUC1)
VGAGFNRDYWARFEKFVKDCVKHSNDVYVVTGPVFAPVASPQGLRSMHGYIGACATPSLILGAQ